MKIFGFVLIATWLLFLTGCFSAVGSARYGDSATAGDLVKALSNDDIVWEGTYLGLQPQLSTLAQRVLGQGEEAVPFLRAAVVRNDQFVVAHVLLTKITATQYSADGKQWNRLRVHISASNKVSYGDGDHAVLVRMWFRGPADSNGEKSRGARGK